MVKVHTHLMFQGAAPEALALYASVFPDFAVVATRRHDPDGPGAGTTETRVDFAGHSLIVIDSPPVHAFTFTPSMSLFVDFDSAEALSRAFARLSAGGQIVMPPGDYGFSRLFGWTADRFGVSWQLNLP